MSVMLKGTLLVPVENLQSNCNFMWVGTLNSSNNHVDVIAFKTAKKDDFVSLMKADAESLQTMEQTPNVKAQLNYIDKLLEEISEPIWVKIPEQLLLDAANSLVSEYQRRSGASLTAGFTRENTIYTSGVVAV